jgi:uncharacterized membrane-anchored protein YjiN (DUF445 family)
MDINKAVQRLGWRFEQSSKRTDHRFTINQNDLDALKTIDAFVVKNQKEQLQNQELFAKLYINNLTELIEHYNTTIFDPIPRRRIHEILRQSLPDLTEKLKDTLNDSEKYELMKEIGIDLKHPLLRTDEETENDLDKLQDALIDTENKKRLLGDVWDFETVKDCVEMEVNSAINLY